MNKKQDMVEKDSFRQAGEDLLRKVREEERADLRLALSSWQKLEERLNAPRKTSVLRILLSCFFRSGRHHVASCRGMLFLDDGT